MASLYRSMYESNDDAKFIMNPYGSSVLVTDPTQFYGRRNDILRVIVSIRDWEPFAVTGEPRIGKSSFLYYLTHPDGVRKQVEFLAHLRNPDAYLFVLIELQLLPVRNSQGFWRYLFDRLVEEAKEARIETEALQAEYHMSVGSDDYQLQISFERYVKHVEKKVLFLFDDFDIIIKDFLPAEVIQITDKLRTLKALTLNNKLNYVIVSTDPLVRLFKAKGITSPSPLSSIIIPAPPLGLLENDAVYDLLQKPFQQSTTSIQPFSEEEITFICKLAGRYPDLMKISSFYLYSARIRGSVEYELVLQDIRNDDRVQWLMQILWERAKQDELPLEDVLLQVAQGQVLTNLAAYKELCQRGLVDNSISPPQIFGELFRIFVLNSSSHPVISAELTPSLPKLTPLESKLYTYLTEHVEQTCTREQLQKVIWGDKPSVSSDALEQLVKRLRGKIEPNPDQPMYLLNVRGQGYLLRQMSSR